MAIYAGQATVRGLFDRHERQAVEQAKAKIESYHQEVKAAVARDVQVRDGDPAIRAVPNIASAAVLTDPTERQKALKTLDAARAADAECLRRVDKHRDSYIRKVEAVDSPDKQSFLASFRDGIEKERQKLTLAMEYRKQELDEGQKIVELAIRDGSVTASGNEILFSKEENAQASNQSLATIDDLEAKIAKIAAELNAKPK